MVQFVLKCILTLINSIFDQELILVRTLGNVSFVSNVPFGEEAAAL